MTRYLIHANSPSAPTGYGVQCKHLAEKLADEGHEVAVSVTWGHQVGVGQWTSPKGHKIRLYPSGYLMNSVDMIHQHAMHWFGNDPKAGWIITVLDVWCLTPNPALREFKVLAWTPVDHFPAPPEVLKFFEVSNAVPVAMSKFGQRQLQLAGFTETEYVPLAVDTSVFKPTPVIESSEHGEVDPRDLFDVPANAFVVAMVAMNKDRKDRKGFGVAFQAFAEFRTRHSEAVLVMHTDREGMADGLNLPKLAARVGVPESAIVWTDQYAYRLGAPDEAMAALYTMAHVLLAPSKGEGFGVPLIEAQACGTPVIASRFTSQTELVGGGWTVGGQLEADADQGYCFYFNADVRQVVDALELAYTEDERSMMEARAKVFAQEYDVDRVWQEHWLPLLDSLDAPERQKDEPLGTVLDIIVPVMRGENHDRFYRSLEQTAPKGDGVDIRVHLGDPEQTYSENVNELVSEGSAPWVLIVGDDVEFAPGWFSAAREGSEYLDVIGTNDSELGRIRNPLVATGDHADHFFIRRSYIEEHGACLDGPGVTAPEAYRHWYTDREIVWLAQARGVWGFAKDCRIIHHHPGYEGDEEARQSDPLYVKAVAASKQDAETFAERAPLIAQHKVGRR